MDANSEIIKSLTTIYRFSDEQLNAFTFKLKVKKVSKKEFLLKPSQSCCFVTFINKGSFRFYSLTESEERTLHFFTENNWVEDYESLISHQPSKNYLQAVEDTEVQMI